MIFLLLKQYFEKTITGQRQWLIVLNPFLDSLCNSAFKNIGLTPGTGSICFQSSQDIVIDFYLAKVEIWKSSENLQMSRPFSQILQILSEILNCCDLR